MAEPGGTEARGDPSPWRILVAEDNAVTRKVTLLLLEKLGCRGEGAGDYSGAVRALEAHPFDAVFVDIESPTLGFEAVAAVRALEAEGRHTPIIGITTGGPELGRERCRAAGLDDCVARPLTRNALSEVVSPWLSPAPGPRVGERSPVDLTHFRQEMEEAGCLAESDDIVRSFLRTSPERVRALSEAVVGGDSEAVRSAAHALKGSTRVMEAHHLAVQCEALESAGREGDVEAARAGMPDLLEEFERVAAFLKHALDTDPVG